MYLHWLRRCAAAVPPGEEWLSAEERARLVSLRMPKRRADFRLGRFAAKQAVAAYLGGDRAPAPHEIELRPEPSGAPEVYVGGAPAQLALSLSHCDGQALCAVAEPAIRLGCDLERIEDRGPAFMADFFTEEEQAFLSSAPGEARPALCTVLWSAKESALKALKTGLRLDTREVRVTLSPEPAAADGFRPLSVLHVGSAVRFRGFFRVEPPLVLVLVSFPPVAGLRSLPGPL